MNQFLLLTPNAYVYVNCQTNMFLFVFTPSKNVYRFWNWMEIDINDDIMIKFTNPIICNVSLFPMKNSHLSRTRNVDFIGLNMSTVLMTSPGEYEFFH